MTQFVVIDVETGERDPAGVFEHGSNASAYARQLATDKGRKYRVVKIASVDAPTWHDREQRLFDALIYKRVPWHDEEWNEHFHHFCHVSRKHPSKVAFTKNDEHGERDIQTVMRPGRYLTAYYADRLSADAIKEWCGKYAAENEELELRFATTPDEIEEVYTHGPRSCMSHDVSDYDTDGIHPVRVYGAGDLAIAYIEDADNDNEGDSDCGDSRVTARSICWPEKKVYGRVYGDESRLRELLKGAGYKEQSHRNSFNGARLLRLETDDGGLIAPYLDHVYNARDDGKFLVLDEDGDISCQNTNGLAENGTICEHCSERAIGETYHVDGETWCEYCYENDSFNCYDCNNTYAGSCHITTHNGHDLCESCAEDYTRCKTCGEYYPSDDIREDIHGDCYCEDCASELAKTHCGQLASDKDDCDCRECDQWREDHADLFGNASEQTATVRVNNDGLVWLKPTSPKVSHYNQLEMTIIHRWGELPYFDVR